MLGLLRAEDALLELTTLLRTGQPFGLLSQSRSLLTPFQHTYICPAPSAGQEKLAPAGKPIDYYYPQSSQLTNTGLLYYYPFID